MKDIGIYRQALPTYSLRHEMLNEIDHTVVPVVMMVEGVHSGSRGPLLHLSSELAKSAPAWNGTPVTIQHPQDSAGNYISANSPQVLTDWATGKVFNARMDAGRLVGEAWIETARVTTLSPETLATLTSGEALEVSVGVFSDEEETQGTHAGESYTAIARNHRPDHLALLPGGTGACSVADGCGVRVYKLIKGGKDNVMKKLSINEENLLEVLKDLNKQGYSSELIVFERSLEDQVDLVRAALYAMDTDQLDHYVREVYSDYLIYKVYTRTGNDSTSKLYKQSYAIVDNTVTWVGERTEVVRNVTYNPVPATNTKKPLKRTKFNLNQEEVDMPKECTPCVKARVDGLIAHAKTQFIETDRVWLETLEEVALEKMCPDKVIETPAAPVANTEKKDWLADAPQEVREQIQHGINVHNQHKAATVAAIIANTAEGTWDKAELEGMKIEVLTKIASSVAKEAAPANPVIDYSGMGNFQKPQVNVEEVFEPMLPTGIVIEETK